MDPSGGLVHRTRVEVALGEEGAHRLDDFRGDGGGGVVVGVNDSHRQPRGLSNVNHADAFVDHFFQGPLDKHPQRLAGAAASGASSDQVTVNRRVLNIDDFQVAAVAAEHGPHVFVDHFVDLPGELVGREGRRIRPG